MCLTIDNIIEGLNSHFDNKIFKSGYDESGNLTLDPAAVIKTKRALPIGFWKGSGLALVLDIVLTAISGGRSTAGIHRVGKEVGLSQCFICIHTNDLHPGLVEDILNFTRSGSNSKTSFPGENTLRRRKENDANGIPVNASIWKEVLAM